MQLIALTQLALTQLASTQLALPQAAHWSIPAAAESFISACRAFAEPAAGMAVTAVWQGAAIACGLALCLRLAPRTSAEHRFSIWAAAFATLVSLPFLALFEKVPGAALSGVSSASSVVAARPLLDPLLSVNPLLHIDARWSVAIAALWAVATLLRAVDLVLHSFRLRKIWKDAIPVDLDGRLHSMLASAPSLSSRMPVEVCTTTTLQRPSVIGFFKPRILIPDWLFARLTPGELEQIVLHEAEHLRRRDDWTNLVQKICLVLFPLNPALAWIERRLCREREMACDEGVIRITNAPRAYAACLASLAERGLQHRAEALSLGAWQRRPELVHRVHSILRRKRTLGPFATRALLGAVGCGLLAGSVELARCPQLIAFVPAHDVKAAQSEAQPLHGADSSVQVAGIQNVSLAFKGQGIASPRASNRQPKPVAASVSRERTAFSQDAALEWKTAAIESANHAPRPVLLKAEIPSKRTAPAHEPQQQQWIVFTTWEQVQIANPNAGMRADYETGAKQNTAGDQNVPTETQPAGQIFVTQLILRMFPASSSSTQPASASMRSGWFVIQL